MLELLAKLGAKLIGLDEEKDLVPIIMGTITGLVKALQELGEDIPDLVIACEAEAKRIGDRQLANEAEARREMGLPSDSPA